MRLKAHLAVGRDPLDAAIGGDALLKAAVHQLWVIALLLHLVKVRVRVRTRERTTRAKTLLVGGKGTAYVSWARLWRVVCQTASSVATPDVLSLTRGCLRGSRVARTSSLSARYALPVAAVVREVSDDTEDEGPPGSVMVMVRGG